MNRKGNKRLSLLSTQGPRHRLILRYGGPEHKKLNRWPGRSKVKNSELEFWLWYIFIHTSFYQTKLYLQTKMIQKHGFRVKILCHIISPLQSK